MKVAAFWHTTTDGRVQCELCPHRCTIADGHTGRCRVRRAEGGTLFAASYGQVSSLNVDPIEKKPLYHFRPGSTIFSAGGWGCNFRCSFCQNWTISQQVLPSGPTVSPTELIAKATASGTGSIAFTYNEPLIAYEYVCEAAAAARADGLSTVLVTNGFINPVPAYELLPLIDAANIDLKSMADAFYIEHCGGRVEPVKQFARQAVAAGVHVEITNLVIPGLNDSDAAFSDLSRWVAEALGPTTPLHLSAYHPQHEMTREPTDAATLERGARLCGDRLAYVYIGNIATRGGRNTTCPACRSDLISRVGYGVQVNGLSTTGGCRSCGRAFDGVL